MRTTVLLWVADLAAAMLVVPGVQAQEVKPPNTVIPRDGCVTAECHPGTKERPFLHGPLHANACDACHRLTNVEKHKYEHVRKGQQMCLFCHDLRGPESPDLLHEPLKKGECLSCHDPHCGNGKSLLRGVQYPDMCKSCHKDETGAKLFVHGPAAGSCGACHEPHGSNNHKLLPVTGKDLCLRCHVVVGVQIETQDVVHEPAKDSCEVCHDPHATDNPGMLKDDPVSLCTSCHKDVGHIVDIASSKHAAVTTKQSCLNCHDAHASKNQKLLKTSQQTLCFECHDKELLLESGRLLVNVKEAIQNAKVIHGPAAEGGCVSCHEIHGGGHKRLLAGEYPAAAYYPFQDSMYSLCFSCHDKQLVLQEEAPAITEFRNGRSNLHYVHVHKDKKGRTCFVCHDSHAADRAHLLREEFPYGPGGWMLAIDWKPIKDGGSCAAGCHPSYEYNRVKPVVYPEIKGTEQDWRGNDLVPGKRATPPRMKAPSPGRKGAGENKKKQKQKNPRHGDKK